jgi:SAM-dependent methyltransferase
MDERMEANRANWDDRVAIHVASEFYDVAGWLAGRRDPRPWEIELMGPVEGLDVVHLQCHFGLDTLSLAHAGARVVGVDFSAPAVAQARELAERAGLADRAHFVESDVHDAAAALAPATFDLVYVSLGALCWLPSVARWAEQVRALLRPGGRLFFHDTHPLSWSLANDEEHVRFTYFEEPVAFTEDSDVTYTDGDVLVAHPRSYEWNHSVGETVTALLAQGLRLDRLTEHDWTSFPRFPWLVRTADQRWETPPDHPRIPLSLTILASLPG